MTTPEHHAEAILRAAGSSLRHYTMPGTRQAILDAVREAMGPGWRGMESAPRDGTIILLSGGQYFCESRNRYIQAPSTAAWYIDPRGDCYWLIGGTEGGYCPVTYEDPVAWLPLPPSDGGR